MTDASELMTSFIAFFDTFAELSLSLKLSWALIVVWIAAQVVWYRRLRVEPPPASAPKRQPRRRAPRKKQADPDPASATTDPLSELGVSASALSAATDNVYR